MIMLSPGTAVLTGALLLTLVMAGGVLIFLGLRARADAAGAVDASAQLQTILDGSPAIVTVIRSGGRIEMTQRMADWLGLEAPPRSIA